MYLVKFLNNPVIRARWTRSNLKTFSDCTDDGTPWCPARAPQFKTLEDVVEYIGPMDNPKVRITNLQDKTRDQWQSLLQNIKQIALDHDNYVYMTSYVITMRVINSSIWAVTPDKFVTPVFPTESDYQMKWMNIYEWFNEPGMFHYYNDTFVERYEREMLQRIDDNITDKRNFSEDYYKKLDDYNQRKKLDSMYPPLITV